MKAEKMQEKDRKDFIAFCLRNRDKVDDSYLDEDELNQFILNEENPTFVVNQEDRIIAAASLILDDYHKRGKSGRFRIFYSEKNELQLYTVLLEEILKQLQEIDKVFLFAPLTNQELQDELINLKFEIDRYVYLLVREVSEPMTIYLPQGYSIREFQPGMDEEVWCKIRNIAFSTLKGHTTPVTPEMIYKQRTLPDYLEGGMMILTYDNEPIGIIRASEDDYEGESAMNIGPLAILPEYQGKGLGRELLRATVDFAYKKFYKKIVLCVNAENERAKDLYLKEGFTQVEGVVSYEYRLH